MGIACGMNKDVVLVCDGNEKEEWLDASETKQEVWKWMQDKRNKYECLTK